MLLSWLICYLGVGLVSGGINLHSRYVRASKGEAKVHSLKIESRIASRFATTHITSLVENVNAEEAADVTFTAQLPSDAFISNFTMLRGTELLVANVKPKEEAQRDFDAAKAAGRTTGLVKQKPRETDVFETTVSIKPGEKVLFNLTYQEVLKRVHGLYKHAVNILDSEGIDDVSIDVFITERGEITNLHIPEFAPKIAELTNKELLQRPVNPLVDVEKSEDDEGLSTVHASFTPKSGSQGQLVVLYDVKREVEGGEVEVVDGFFVHFFAPPADFIDRISARIVFVLDKSGSMSGRKFDQLQQAMETILAQLKEEDQFSIVWFSSETEAWSETLRPANDENKEAAIEFVKKEFASGGTNIHDALLQGLTILDKLGEVSSNASNMVLFLTDGEATAGPITENEPLREAISKRNEVSRIRIHSLAFGDNADFDLLKNIALDSRGLARKIYESSDAALQLDGFYNEIALPIFSDVEFTYLNNSVDPDSIIRSRRDGTVYSGSEMAVVGKLSDPEESELVAEVKAASPIGKRSFTTSTMCFNCCRRPCPRICGLSSCIFIPDLDLDIKKVEPAKLPANTLGGFVERMWAYMTIKKKLEDADISADSSEAAKLRREAKELALAYNFVTSETSLVIADVEPTIRPLEAEEEDGATSARRSFSVLSSRPGGLMAAGGSRARFAGLPGRPSPSMPMPVPMPTRPHPSSIASSRGIIARRRNALRRVKTKGKNKKGPLKKIRVGSSSSGSGSSSADRSALGAAFAGPTATLEEAKEEEEADVDEEAPAEAPVSCDITLLLLLDPRADGGAEREELFAKLQTSLAAKDNVELRSARLESDGNVAASEAGAFFAKAAGRQVLFLVLAGPEDPHFSLNRSIFPFLVRSGAKTLVAHNGSVRKSFFVLLSPIYVASSDPNEVASKVHC